MPYLDPKFPVINPNPTVVEALSASRISDYFTVIFATTGSWAFGYLGGKPLRFATASTAATLGFTFGTLYLLQNNRGRLLGFKENRVEERKYGRAPDEFQPKKIVQEDPRFPVGGNASTIRKKPDWSDYTY